MRGRPLFLALELAPRPGAVSCATASRIVEVRASGVYTPVSPEKERSCCEAAPPSLFAVEPTWVELLDPSNVEVAKTNRLIARAKLEIPEDAGNKGEVMSCDLLVRVAYQPEHEEEGGSEQRVATLQQRIALGVFKPGSEALELLDLQDAVHDEYARAPPSAVGLAAAVGALPLFAPLAHAIAATVRQQQDELDACNATLASSGVTYHP